MGLAAAYRAAKNGHEVDLLEAAGHALPERSRARHVAVAVHSRAPPAGTALLIERTLAAPRPLLPDGPRRECRNRQPRRRPRLTT